MNFTKRFLLIFLALILPCAVALSSCSDGGDLSNSDNSSEQTQGENSDSTLDNSGAGITDGSLYMKLEKTDGGSTSGTVASGATYTFKASALNYDTKADLTAKCGTFTWSLTGTYKDGITLTPSGDTRTCTVTLPSVTSLTVLTFTVKVTDTATAKGAYFNDDDYDDVGENGYRGDEEQFVLTVNK